MSVDTSVFLAHPETEIPQNKLAAISKLVNERKTGKPMAYVLESRSFFHSDFFTPEGVLIPQPDTETLVEEAVKTACGLSDKSSVRILDLCAGTGCIGISVAKELSPFFNNVYLTLSDISLKAYEVFSVNCKKLITEKNIHINRICGNLFEKIEDKFNLILSNPPYIKTSLIPTLPSEVQAEPVIALDGGKNGTELIFRIITESRNHAMENACMLMEIGYDQGLEVSTMFKSNSMDNVSVIKDLGNCDRVVKGFFK